MESPNQTPERFDATWTRSDRIRSYFKVFFMVLRGLRYYPFVKTSKGLLLVGRGAKIRNAKYLSTSGTVVIEDYAEIQCLSKKGIHLGKGVTIGRFAMIRPSGYYGREIGEGFEIGAGSNIGAYSYIGCSGYVKIGEQVMMGPRVSILPENHVFENTSVTMKEQGVIRGNVVIGDDCWIAANACILSEVTLHKGSIVATGAVVNKTFPPYSVIGGVPGKLLKSRKSGE